MYEVSHHTWRNTQVTPSVESGGSGTLRLDVLLGAWGASDVPVQNLTNFLYNTGLILVQA